MEGAISSPGSADAALTVGAIDKSGAMADFSRRGPRAPDDGIKPDLTAPGVGITAARAHTAGEVPGKPGDAYTTLSGTSMATPHVAGVAALVLQRHPQWTAAQLKATLMATAEPNEATGVYAQGAGRVDARAIRQTIRTSPPAASFGRQAWPHTDDSVLTRTITYHNDAAAATTLALRMAGSLPAGMVSLSTETLTIPAYGQASVLVTLDTRVPGPDGLLGGWLTATGGETVVRTPVAVNKEIESYDLTLRHIDRDGGEPSVSYPVIGQYGGATPTQQLFVVGGETLTVRLPKGRYAVITAVYSATGKGAGPQEPTVITLLAAPEIDLSAAQSLVLDAQIAQPATVTVPQPSARQVYAQLGAATANAGTAVLGNDYSSMFIGRIGPDTTVDGFNATVAGQWAHGNADGTVTDSPYLVTLYYPIRDRMITGYQRRVSEAELARVHADYAATAPGTTAQRRVNTGVADLDTGDFGPFLSFHLPFQRMEYYNTDAGVGSYGELYESSADTLVAYTASAQYVEYRANRQHRERWNGAVFTPALAAPNSFAGWSGVTRTGDSINVDVPTYGDGAGHVCVAPARAATATLFRNGVRIGELDASQPATFTVPAGAGAYRLVLRSEHPDPNALSRTTTAVWTFRSEHVDAASVMLPLWTVRLAPALDLNNTAPAGQLLAVPVILVAQAGARTGQLVQRSVEASLDGGTTWTTVRLTGNTAFVHTPTGSGTVALRVHAADRAGNAMTTTVVNAYRYG